MMLFKTVCIVYLCYKIYLNFLLVIYISSAKLYLLLVSRVFDFTLRYRDIKRS